MFTPVDKYEERKIKGIGDYRTAPRIQKDFWREKFLEAGEPTGYVFSEAWLEGGFREWNGFRSGYGVKNDLKEWHDTLAVKLQAQGILNIAKQRESFQASKWLADQGWLEKMDKRTKEAKKNAERAHEEIQNDMARLGLKLVKKQ
jgi:hypothetical protein